jgi:hypothetical protein
MSGKSKLKTDVMRGAPFAAAGLQLTEDAGALVPPAAGPLVRTVIEDASVRYAAGPGGRPDATGATLLESFWRPVAAAFAELPGLHTYVVLFDKKRYVPGQKAGTQASRRDALAASSRRQQVADWTWDGQASIIGKLQPLPPWSRLRLDGRAYAKALDELVALMVADFVPPPRCRIIFDWQGGMPPMVLEADAAGTVRTAYADGSLANTAGEADMAAQWYARLVRTGAMRAPGRPSGGGDDDDDDEGAADLPARPMAADLAAKYYGARETAAAAPLRADYEPGDVVLRSTDTDYLPLSMLHYALLDPDDGPPGTNVWLAMGACHVRGPPCPEPRSFCTKGTAGAVPRGEVYSVRDLCAAVATLHPPDTPLPDAVASFVAFCTACGNDYVSRRYGLTHAIMFAAYRRAPLLAPWAPARGANDGWRPPVALVCPASFATFLRQCYWHKLGPRHWPLGLAAGGGGGQGQAQGTSAPAWQQVGLLVRGAYTRPEAQMPTLAQARADYEALVWALAYACTGPHGHGWVPQ